MEIIKTWEDHGLIVVKPAVPSKKKPGDPYGDAVAIAETDFEGMFGAKTLQWDTMTWRAKVFLQMSASMGKFGNNISFGTGGLQHKMPQKGDYGAAQSMAMELRQLLFAHEDMHLFIAGHQVIAEIEGPEGVVGNAAGFGLVGKASIGTYGDIFNQYLRMHVVQKHAMMKGQDSSRKVMLQLVKGQVFDAGIRSTVEMPEEIEVGKTLDSQRQVWRDLEGYARVPLDGSRGRWRCALYSPPKVGKTQLLTSIPDEAKPIVYVADDPGSEHLPSTHPEVLGEATKLQGG